MGIHLMRRFSSHGLLTVLLTLSSLGCFTKVHSEAGAEGAKCAKTTNCREGLICVPSGGKDGTCQKPDAGAAGSVDAPAGKTDSSLDVSDDHGATSEVKAEVAPMKLDSNLGPEAKDPDTAPVQEDAPGISPDSAQPDAASPDAPQPGSPDTRPADTAAPDALPCNGGCCSHTDCPLDKPVCNQAHACVGCTADTDCTGRSLTACQPNTGACVQCTQKSHCGASLSCDLTTNTCVGCTERSDCPSPCQTCSKGSCVSLKNADDPSKCAGTCDSAGECKAKQGQRCDVAGGCIGGTTCADGICCNRACSGACEACDSATQPGTCTVLTVGSQPRHGTCGSDTGNNAACAGSCQGNADGACSYPSATTVCGTAGCNANVQSQASGTCNGAGQCALPAPVSCKTGGTCAAGTCGCPASLPNECPNACVDFNTDAQNCGSCGHDCLGGTCLAGICQPVVVSKPASSMQIEVFGLDAQYIYYQNLVGTMSADHYRISINAVAGTGESLRKASMARSTGVTGGVVYFLAEQFGTPMSCQAADCKNTLAPLDVATGAYLISFGNPAPASYSTSREDPDTGYLRITWYNPGDNRVVASWPDTVSPNRDYHFIAYGDSVYWVRETATDNSVFAVNSSKQVRERMAGQLSSGWVIHNVNAYSLLLLSDSSLYRVPMPLGMGNNRPTLVLSGASADVQRAIEDAEFLYWADSAGTIYKCPSSDLANCENKKVLLTTGAPTTGFLQDAKSLYWGTVGTPTILNGQLFRMAK